MKKILALFALTVVATFPSCNIQPQDDQDEATKYAKSLGITINTQWEYLDAQDKMSSDKEYSATIYSPYLLDFGQGYRFKELAMLAVINKEKENTIGILVTEAHFVDNGIDSNYLRVQFDANPDEAFHYSIAEDRNTSKIIILNADKFIAELKKSKTVVVEAPFENHGTRQMLFNIAGLAWNH